MMKMFIKTEDSPDKTYSINWKQFSRDVKGNSESFILSKYRIDDGRIFYLFTAVECGAPPAEFTCEGISVGEGGIKPCAQTPKQRPVL
jgi:hypothetical protein